MRKHKWLVLLLVLLIIPSMTLAGQHDGPTDEITLRLAVFGLPDTLDPAAALTMADIQTITNIFVGLTAYDPETSEVVPMLAQSWEATEDGRVWTFTLRDDVPWVFYDLSTGEIEEQRTITSADVIYSVQRMCTDASFGYYAVDVFAPIIAGCQDALRSGDGDDVQVVAEDDTTVVFTLNAPTSAFLAMTPLWTLAPVPQEAIEEHGSGWASPGNIWTSGPFALESSDVDKGIVVVRNPYFPTAIRGDGNIDRVQTLVNEFSMYEMFAYGELARIDINVATGEALLAEEAFTGDVMQSPSLGIFYFGISTDRPPMNNVHVRRAFAAAIDRQAFLDEYYDGGGVAMAHFSPEWIPFGPPLEAAFDVGFDPDFARAELAAAGYAGCEGLPQIEVVGWTDTWGQFLATSLTEVLGCAKDVVVLEDATFDRLTDMIDPRRPVENRPHLWAMGWNPDYGDVHTYIGVLACGETNSFMRECNHIDTMINKAQATIDPALRQLIYLQIEELLFGENGEFPMIPLFQEGEYIAVQSWFDGPHATDGAFSGIHYDYYTIDTSSCQVRSYGATADLYAAPSFMAETVGVLREGDSMRGIGQAVDDSGFRWWQLEDESWISAFDVVTEGFCGMVPVIGIPDA